MKKSTFLSLLFVVSIISSNYAQEGSMSWVALPNGESNGSCFSTSDCDNDILCFGLQYTPKATGVVTSYTTGFKISYTGGADLITTNSSCSMVGENAELRQAGSNLTFLLSSGHSGSNTYDKNTATTIHQVCFSIPVGGEVTIEKTTGLGLSSSINLADGTTVSDLPNYTTFVLNRDTECANTALTSVDLTNTVKPTVSIYPNPATTSIIVEHNLGAKATYELMSADGKVLKGGILDIDRETVDIAELPPSIYFLRVGDTIHKVLKMK